MSKSVISPGPSQAQLTEHQRHHPATQMARLHSDATKIAPTWTKVSSTPWEARSKLNGGYGKRIQRTSISPDTPSNFLNPESVPPPVVPRMDPTAASVTRVSKLRDPKAITFVLPGGDSCRAKPAEDKYRSFPFGKQMILEPVIAGAKARSPLKWDDSPQNSRRPSEGTIAAKRAATEVINNGPLGAARKASNITLG